MDKFTAYVLFVGAFVGALTFIMLKYSKKRDQKK